MYILQLYKTEHLNIYGCSPSPSQSVCSSAVRVTIWRVDKAQYLDALSLNNVHASCDDDGAEMVSWDNNAVCFIVRVDPPLATSLTSFISPSRDARDPFSLLGRKKPMRRGEVYIYAESH